tara:strand:- start:4884 stop:5483 length:600 start_codon:yes stop_codon:yes gene_type:complete
MSNFILEQSSKEHFEGIVKDLESRDAVPLVGAHLIDNRDFEPSTVSLIMGMYDVKPDYVGPVTYWLGEGPNLDIFELKHGVYITAYDGVKEAWKRGHFIINTHTGLASVMYLENMTDANCLIEPFDSDLNRALDFGARIINDRFKAGEDVTVNCAMGMERSVLLVGRWLRDYQGYDEEQWYEFVQSKRPIAVDRREWIV